MKGNFNGLLASLVGWLLIALAAFSSGFFTALLALLRYFIWLPLSTSRPWVLCSTVCSGLRLPALAPAAHEQGTQLCLD